MPAPADSNPQVTTGSRLVAAPATSMVWQQQLYQGQHSMFGVLDMVPDVQSLDRELSMLRQRAHQVTADRLHLQPHLSPIMAPAAPAPAANSDMGRFSLFGEILKVAQTERLPKRQWRSSSGSTPPPQELLGALPIAAAPWLEPSSVDPLDNAQPSPTHRPAAKKPRHAGPAAATEAEEEIAGDAFAPRAAPQLFLQQILADLYAEQDPNTPTATLGPQFPQRALAAPGPLEPVQFKLWSVAGPTPDPVVPAPVSPAAGAVHPPETGNSHGRNPDWPFRDLKFRVDSTRKSLVRLQRQQDLEGQELAEAVAQKTPLHQVAQLKHAFFHSEMLKKHTRTLFESLKQNFKVESGAWRYQRKQQQQQQQ